MRNIFLFLLFIASVLTAKDLDPIYLDIPAYKYLIGDFSSSKLKYYKDAENGRVFHMRNDVFSQFQKMKKAYETYAREKKLKVKTISLRSAFRSFNDQKYIWETKFTGQKKMGKSVKGKTAEERAKLILEYSSAPGTSRHHWGTDLDLNSLSNTYFGKGGPGKNFTNGSCKTLLNTVSASPITNSKTGEIKAISKNAGTGPTPLFRINS